MYTVSETIEIAAAPEVVRAKVGHAELLVVRIC
jgi:hypothetical protein